MTEVQDFQYWTDKLNENKTKYKDNEIPKDEYQKNGRRIRAKRRKAVAASTSKPEVVTDSGGSVTNTPPVPKKTKSRKRKKAKIVKKIGFGYQNSFYRDMTEAIDAFLQTELPYPKPIKAEPMSLHSGHWQAIPMTRLRKSESLCLRNVRPI